MAGLNLAPTLDHIAQLGEQAESRAPLEPGEGRGGVEMNKGRSDRLVLTIDPGSPTQRLLDVTNLQGAYTQKKRASVAPRLSENEVVSRFMAINGQAAAPVNGVVKLSSTPVTTPLGGAYSATPQSPRSTHMEKAAMNQNGIFQPPQPMGLPATANGASPFTQPQISQPAFSSPATEPVPHPTRALYWDVPGYEKAPDLYHDLLLDEDKRQLILVRDARYREFTSLRPPVAVGENVAFNLAGSNEVYFGALVGSVWQHGNSLYQTFYVLDVFTLADYLRLKIQATTPTSPFAQPANTPAAYPPPTPPPPPQPSGLPTLEELERHPSPTPPAPTGVVPPSPGILQPAAPGIGDFLEAAMEELRVARPPQGTPVNY